MDINLSSSLNFVQNAYKYSDLNKKSKVIAGYFELFFEKDELFINEKQNKLYIFKTIIYVVFNHDSALSLIKSPRY